MLYAAEWELDKGSKEIGGKLDFTSMRQGDLTWRTLAIGPAMTYYFGNSDSKNWPFLGANFLITSENWEDSDDYGDNDNGSSGTSLQFTGGMTFKLVDHFVLKSGLFYNIDSSECDWDGAKKQSGNVFGLAFGFSGLVY